MQNFSDPISFSLPNRPPNPNQKNIFFPQTNIEEKLQQKREKLFLNNHEKWTKNSHDSFFSKNENENGKWEKVGIIKNGGWLL
jgi:hypothetical protein